MTSVLRLLKRCVVSTLFIVAASAAHSSSAWDKVDIKARFKEAGVRGTFVLLDAQSGEYLRHDPSRAKTRYLPASTYKIPNSLIALETGVAAGSDFPLAWDPAKAPRQPWWPAAWAKDHDLASAFKNSVVWYYQEIARRIGPQRMQTHLDRFAYGNRNISGGIDQFWLSGDLRISADEQVDFLRRFYYEKLGVSKRSTELVKEILVMEDNPQYRLSGKSGWAALEDPSKPQLGWLVGYLERRGRVYFYAMNIDIQKPEDAAARMKITKAVLGDAGLLN